MDDKYLAGKELHGVTMSAKQSQPGGLGGRDCGLLIADCGLLIADCGLKDGRAVPAGFAKQSQPVTPGHGQSFIINGCELALAGGRKMW